MRRETFNPFAGYSLWCAQCSLGATRDVRAACADCLTSVGSDAAGERRAIWAIWAIVMVLQALA